MKAYLEEFLETFEYPAESRPVLVEALGRIESVPESRKGFIALLCEYDRNKDCDFRAMAARMDQLAQCAGVHPYTGRLVLFICLSRQLQLYYQQAGLPWQLWHDCMLDLRYKLLECRAVYGIWGTFVDWFGRFYNLTRFTVGRFQFDMVQVGRAYEKDGVVLTPESKALNVHIPRTGTRMDRESVKKSFDDAAAFFRPWFGEEPVVFVCDSWLLFEKHREMLPASSNIVGFMDCFDIVEQQEFPDYEEIWRFFDCKYDPDLDKLPQDSTLRRAYVELMRRGEKTGCGFGIFVYGH